METGDRARDCGGRGVELSRSTVEDEETPCSTKLDSALDSVAVRERDSAGLQGVGVLGETPRRGDGQAQAEQGGGDGRHSAVREVGGGDFVKK